MAKAKPTAKKSARPVGAKSKPAAKKSARKPVAPKRAVVAKSAPQKEAFTAEYREYLERYDLDGAGRPRLTPAEFDRLDEELLDLLALEAERGLNDEQVIRLQELEYLLLDSE
ncbi:MAG: hypothetical protein HZC40_00665 [Chloroflexi bacterium]|nr:hypothetical protein [Chloroflexota bacterium]